MIQLNVIVEIFKAVVFWGWESSPDGGHHTSGNRDLVPPA